MNDVLAIDPGLATGACLVRPEGPELLRSDELDVQQYYGWLEHYLGYYEPGTLSIVCERFTINAETAKKSQAPWSLENIGVLRYLTQKTGHATFELQSPGDAKRFVSNDRLKALELWHVGGGGHALDALRHAVLYLAKHGWSDRRLLETA